MTYLEIDSALVEITRKMCEGCQVKLDAVSIENPTERKAIQLECGMYTFCGNAGELFNTGWEREKVFSVRKRYLNRILHKYPSLNNIFQALNSKEQMCFIAALHAEIYLRDQWIDKKTAELAAAEASGDTKNVFEITIMLGAVKNMFAAWEQWRVENNIFPHMFEGDCQ
ncbi:MAG: hypothetical protein IJA74_02440 [Oscillospiraceae bacterium]|nr:hypothetical protein [Oscillospiraceae bacterium]